MSKIILIGSTSALGSGVATELKSRFPQRFDRIVRIGRKNNSNDEVIIIDIREPSSLISSIEDAKVEVGDVAIIAVGQLGGMNVLNDIEAAKIDEIYATIAVNAALASSVLAALIRAFEKVGGGHIIVFTSVAAHPVLKTNSIYGESKAMLENIVRGFRPTAKRIGVSLCVVRNGFVPTKLNNNRTATPFATSVGEVSRKVAKNFDKKNVIWVPQIWQVISFGLRYLPFVKIIANKKLSQSL